MLALAQKIDDLIEPLRNIAHTFGSPVLDLIIRIYVANIFFVSGWSKFQNFLNGNWDTTVYLFTDIHRVPVLPPEAAAVLGTGAELILPALLVAGLFTRFSAIGLFVMTLVIEFLAVDSFGDGLSSSTHYYWMLLLAVPILKGPGVISLDYLLLGWIRKDKTA